MKSTPVVNNTFDKYFVVVLKILGGKYGDVVQYLWRHVEGET
jgi:hypothetical protein